MPRRSVRIALRGLLIAGIGLGALVLVMRATGLSISLGRPPEFGWTSYPMVKVYWAEPAGSLTPGKLPPKRLRRTSLGTLVSWADGTRTLYVHRAD
jgi:hypothetical protein